MTNGIESGNVRTNAANVRTNAASDRTCPDMSGMSGRPDNGVWHTVPEAAEVLRVSPKTVYQMCKEGSLQHRKCGRVIRVHSSALEQI